MVSVFYYSTYSLLPSLAPSVTASGALSHCNRENFSCTTNVLKIMFLRFLPRTYDRRQIIRVNVIIIWPRILTESHTWCIRSVCPSPYNKVFFQETHVWRRGVFRWNESDLLGTNSYPWTEANKSTPRGPLCTGVYRVQTKPDLSRPTWPWFRK